MVRYFGLKYMAATSSCHTMLKRWNNQEFSRDWIRCALLDEVLEFDYCCAAVLCCACLQTLIILQALPEWAGCILLNSSSYIWSILLNCNFYC